MIRGSLLLTTMLVCLPQMARAGDPVQQLFVELVVNGRATGDLVPLRIVGTRMLVPAEALSRNGVTLEGEGGGTERDMEAAAAHPRPLRCRAPGAPSRNRARLSADHPDSRG